MIRIPKLSNIGLLRLILLRLFHRIKYNKLIKDIYQYKNKYSGKRCFVIGTGPSLTKCDLEKLANEYTFASNRIYKMFDKTKWRPTFYTVSDAKFFYQNFEVISKLDGFIKFFPLDLCQDYKKSDNSFYYIRGYNYFKKYAFSNRADLYIYDGVTVTYQLLQLAAFMGFKEIYLLGIDFNYSVKKAEDGSIIIDSNVKDYFTDEKASGNANLPDVEGSLENYIASKKFADLNNIKIFNATRGGKLEVFPRIDLDSLF